MGLNQFQCLARSLCLVAFSLCSFIAVAAPSTRAPTNRDYITTSLYFACTRVWLTVTSRPLFVAVLGHYYFRTLSTVHFSRLWISGPTNPSAIDPATPPRTSL